MKIRIRISKLIRVFMLAAATVLSVVTAIGINVDAFSMIDIDRIKLVKNATHGIGEVRFGIWSFCLYRDEPSDGNLCDIFSPCDNFTGTTRLCSRSKYGYSFSMTKPGQPVVETIGPVWTRALPLHIAVALLMCISFIATCIPGRWAKLIRLCFYVLTLLIALATFLADYSFTYHIKMSIVKGLSTLGLATSSLDGTGMVLQIASGVILFIEFMLDYLEDKDSKPIVYPVLPEGRRVDAQEGYRPQQDRLKLLWLALTRVKPFFAAAKKRLESLNPFFHISQSKATKGGNGVLPSNADAYETPLRQIYSKDPRVRKDNPFVKSKSASWPDLQPKKARQLRK